MRLIQSIRVDHCPLGIFHPGGMRVSVGNAFKMARAFSVSVSVDRSPFIDFLSSVSSACVNSSKKKSCKSHEISRMSASDVVALPKLPFASQTYPLSLQRVLGGPHVLARAEGRGSCVRCVTQSALPPTRGNDAVLNFDGPRPHLRFA